MEFFLTDTCEHTAPSTLYFIVNHPFMYVIQDTKIETILFMGSIQNLN
ncbi:MAG: hypothetical protein II073_07745 [Lachnospiraceae bacterium]|nr:hypothetical protein [Lachnospiraceae bacterium]